MLPFRLKPVFKDYLWGGRKLIDLWGKDSSAPLAESWELAAHKDGDNIILDGQCKNLTLSKAVKLYPEIVSPTFKPDETFPLMVKLIDSAKSLSVQVHPDNDYAMKFENSEGKSEMWYILDHDEGAYLLLGLERDTTREEIKHAINDNTFQNLLHKIEVHRGDIFYLPPGTVHAIGGQITLAEVQDNSNITYRVYDFGRGRELHVTKALDVINTSKYFPYVNDKFHFENISVNGSYIGKKTHETFRFILCIEGDLAFSCGDVKFELHKGGNVFIPANCESDFVINGKGNFLDTLMIY